MEDRLSRVLAFAGVASRRESDRLIQEGHVTVNGQIVTEPGQRVDPAEDHIKVDGKLLQSSVAPIYLLLNKPRGVVASRQDAVGRPTVVTMLKGFKGRIVPVGRIEREDEGAMLLTNDSVLAASLNSPELGIPQTWLLKVRGAPDERTLVRMRTGVPLEKGRTRPMQVEVLSSTDKNTWLKVVVQEVRSQLFEHLLLKLKHPLMKAKRTQLGPLSAKGLQPGTYRQLSEDELNGLRKLVEHPPGVPAVTFVTEEEVQAMVVAAQSERRARAPRPTPVEEGADRPRTAGPGARVRRPRPSMGRSEGAPRTTRPGRTPGAGKLPKAAVVKARATGRKAPGASTAAARPPRRRG